MRTLAAAISMLVLCQGAATAQEMSYGEAEYLNSCAACHGADGRGNGPLAENLTARPSDLTRLAERNGGEFPYWYVFTVIDGRYIVPGHGDRDMPVWGRQFLDDDMKTYGPKGGEIVAMERIHELAAYIQSLQR